MTKLAAAAVAFSLIALAAPARADETPAPDLSARPLPAAALDLRLDGSAGDVAGRRATTVLGLPKNVGPVDRVLRLAVAATLVGIGSYRLANDSPNPGLSWALVGVAAVPAATGATGYCPLYQLLGVDNTF